MPQKRTLKWGYLQYGLQETVEELVESKRCRKSAHPSSLLSGTNQGEPVQQWPMVHGKEEQAVSEALAVNPVGQASMLPQQVLLPGETSRAGRPIKRRQHIRHMSSIGRCDSKVEKSRGKNSINIVKWRRPWEAIRGTQVLTHPCVAPTRAGP